jgi:oxygen-dependent protoporphyrinogen oxidase
VKVAVVGGGIAGLAAAERLGAAGHDVVVIEPEARAGGLVRSERRDGFLCETGPQAILSGRPDTSALVAAAGLESRVIRAREATKRRFVYVRGALRALPSSPPALLKTDLVGAMAKLRLAREPFIPKGDPARDESVLAFCERRFGAEAARAIAAPAVIGVYAGDAANLSIKSALPRLWELEQKHGSVLRGAIAERGQGRAQGPSQRQLDTGPPRSFSFPEGLEELPRALAAKLGGRLVAGRAAALELVGTAFRVHLEPGASTAHVDAERVVLATPAAATAKLLAPLAPAAAAALLAIPVAPVAVAALGFRGSKGSSEPPGHPALGMDLDAYGFIVARGEGPTMLGCQYESSIFEHRAPPGAVLLRALLGGTFEPAIVDATDDAIAGSAVADLRRVAGLRVDPDFVAVWRHPAGIPQYDLAHAARVRAVTDDLARLPGLYVVGQATTGVGVNDGIAAAAALARGFG